MQFNLSAGMRCQFVHLIYPSWAPRGRKLLQSTFGEVDVFLHGDFAQLFWCCSDGDGAQTFLKPAQKCLSRGRAALPQVILYFVIWSVFLQQPRCLLYKHVSCAVIHKFIYKLSGSMLQCYRYNHGSSHRGQWKRQWWQLLKQNRVTQSLLVSVIWFINVFTAHCKDEQWANTYVQRKMNKKRI